MNDLELLTEARRILQPDDKTCLWATVELHQFDPVKGAVCHCILGAIEAADGNGLEYEVLKEYPDADAAFRAVLHVRDGQETAYRLWNWNDSHGRKAGEVIELLDNAINYLKEQQNA